MDFGRRHIQIAKTCIEEDYSLMCTYMQAIWVIRDRGCRTDGKRGVNYSGFWFNLIHLIKVVERARATSASHVTGIISQKPITS